MHDQILIPNGFLSDNSLRSGCFFGGGVNRDRAAIELMVARSLFAPPPSQKKRTTTENKNKKQPLRRLIRK